MIAEGCLGLFEPGEDSPVALVEHALGSADPQPRYNLLDQVSLAVRRQGRDDLFEIQHPGGDQCLATPGPVGPERIEIRQVRHRIDQSAYAEPAPGQHRANHKHDEQSRSDVDKDQMGFEENGSPEKQRYGRSEHREPMRRALAPRRSGATSSAWSRWARATRAPPATTRSSSAVSPAQPSRSSPAEIDRAALLERLRAQRVHLDSERAAVSGHEEIVVEDFGAGANEDVLSGELFG